MNITELENSSTVELIEYVQGKSHYAEAAECAFQNLFIRFENELTKKCRRIAINWGFDQITGDILSEQTLTKFWNKPELFNAKKCKIQNLDRCLLFYLFRMAQNTLADRQREAKSGRNVYTGQEEIVTDFPDYEDSGLPVEKLKEIKERCELIEKALARLSPKHKIIYLTYLTHEQSGINLPRKLSKSIREELDLDQNSIRVYKMQANEAVKQYLEIYGKK